MKLSYLLDIPNTLYFNFRMLPFKEAIKFPFFVSHHFKIRGGGRRKIRFDCVVKPFMVRFCNGGSCDIIPNAYGLISIGRDALVVIQGDAQFAAGCTVRVDHGTLILGKNFSANRNCNISCAKEIRFGEDVLMGCHVAIRDSDGHSVMSGETVKECVKPVSVGNHVWICADSALLKGTTISSDSIVAYRSCVLHSFHEGNLLIGGCPAKIIKTEVNWRK